MRKANTATVDELEEAAVEQDIVQVLHKDHMKVQELFFQFSQSEDAKEKKELFAKISKELAIHAKAEEEIVYSAVRKV